ncbi:hypothetical protein C5748_19555 [Phyllobacterium phragmitis]|uniref:Uncharacterized protein n=1 Tax=Phyllobacterium phragmitis TaxID=2670329 RepID=A0A2S9IMU3_9HYPH|nr:hypothetical protein C5748_19555 [Phyllobacterium phragmitis]
MNLAARHFLFLNSAFSRYRYRQWWFPERSILSQPPASAMCWMAGWALFLRAYLPTLSGPVPRPVFSAASRMKPV